jgi:LytS/YehU family sensor histidine kinase
MEILCLILFFLWLYAFGKKSEQEFKLDVKLSDLHTMSNLMQQAANISDQAKQQEFLSALGALMRYGFEVQKNGFSTVERELFHCRELLRAYSLSSRHGCHLQVDVAPEYHRVKIPGLSLICLLENALQHGVKHGQSADIRLHIHETRNRKLTFAFSGYQLPEAKTLERAPKGHGLFFLKKRLEYCYCMHNRHQDQERLFLKQEQLIMQIPV